MRKISITILVLASLIFVGRVAAQDFIFESIGNGSGSQNNFTFTQSSQTNVNQQNSGGASNNIDASANTGGNSTSGGTGGGITTGDSSVDVNVTNDFNTNKADVNKCCPAGSPTPKPTTKPNPTATLAPGVPTPTPTTKPGNGQNNPPTNGGGDNRTNPTGGGQVLGLAAASGEPVAEYMFYLAGIVCIIAARRAFKSKTFVK